jgi:hypothetical protein
VILILTNEDDITTDFVVRELDLSDFVRVNTEHLSEAGTITYEYDGPSVTGEIRFGTKRLKLEQITAVYCRRLGRPSPNAAIEDDGAREFAQSEFRALIEGLSRVITVPWVNHPVAVHRAESKILQLLAAKRCNLSIPRTIITSDGTRARAFAARYDGPLIAKPLTSSRVRVAGAEQVIFTSLLPSRTDVLDDLQFAPCIVQEQIQKRVDIRATVVGDRVFAVEIDSQSVPEAVVDWRAAGPQDLPHRMHELPGRNREKRHCAIGTHAGFVESHPAERTSDSDRKRSRRARLKAHANGRPLPLENEGQAARLLGAQIEPSLAGRRRKDLLQNPNLLLQVVDPSRHPLVDRVRDRRDEHRRGADEPRCAHPSALRVDYRGKIA